MKSFIPQAAVRHGVLMAGALFMLMPFIWMVGLSLAPESQGLISAYLYFIPTAFDPIGNYTRAFTDTPLPRFMLNGVFICAAVLLLQLAVAAPCAYALAKLSFRGRDTLFSIVLVALLIPQEVLVVPLFVLFYWLGLLNTYAALILPFVVSPFGIFLLRQFFKAVPDDYIHAARLDGFSELAIVWRIMLPAAVPAIIAFAILSVVARWNNLFWPLVAVSDQALMPPSLGVVFFRNEESGSSYGPLMAAATVVVAPLVLAFLMAQRRFVEGLTMSGLK